MRLIRPQFVFLLIFMLFVGREVGGQRRAGSSGGCQEKNGRFPVSGQCDAYIECIDGVAEEKLCPDGLLFNSNARFFSYPCQYPVDVDCEGRSAIQPAQPTADCPHQYGYFRLGDRANCGQFLNCVEGRAFQFDCPEGLAFDEAHLRCDWPDQVESCDAEAYLGFTCPPSEGTYGISGYKHFRSPSDCQKYFICINSRPRMYSCGEGNAYNEEIESCDGVENVTSCYPGAAKTIKSGFRRQ